MVWDFMWLECETFLIGAQTIEIIWTYIHVDNYAIQLSRGIRMYCVIPIPCFNC